MTKQQGSGVQTLSQLVKQLSRLNPVAARKIFDRVDNKRISDVIAACSEARVAQGGELARDAFDESVAARITQRDDAASAQILEAIERTERRTKLKARRAVRS